ncbi:AGE family epimerase/isomerase [Cellulomonas bogoriensis]|uniref:N-acyl-D-glucosamine 2-epimerase n=1 Tax=Cellulomonas bogoriensis 69B4 = DSM 16987 TaxID=1386082 RepID=A0A0A0BYF3_9CELL|nr:AGE family epimerase/isomerase [Cellulomonas bogoriensis]KGM12961.1 N-acyl-D-glucosamine 2-epimerase [Cellulomonas bogoriensis 69B4 = DSM 16987]
MTTWLSSPAHQRWLEAETDRLLTFSHGTPVPDGFGWAGPDGTVDRSRATELWITCRMTHSHALGTLLGRPASGPLVDHGLAALAGPLQDQVHGGWFAAVGPDGPTDTTKGAYPHAFVVLAAASATLAGRAGARELLDRALAVSQDRFWDEDAGMVVESWDRTFTACEEYRGVNATMHTVEAYLVAADATGDRLWLDRAARMTGRVVDGFARDHRWRIPEHFDTAWRPVLDHNADEPAHPFRPFGATVGHWFEWARLTLHLRASLVAQGDEVPAWMLQAPQELVEAGVREGWGADGHPGFVYTVDWDGRPVVTQRMHWVLCEAIAAVSALHAVTGDERYAAWYQQWWEHAAHRFIDHERGSWHHETDPDGRPATGTWAGKPDVYHALQATLLPRLPLAPGLAAGLAHGLLR